MLASYWHTATPDTLLALGSSDLWSNSYTSEQSLQSVTVTKLLFSVLDSSWRPVEGEKRSKRRLPMIQQAHCPACKIHTFLSQFITQCLGLLTSPQPQLTQLCRSHSAVQPQNGSTSRAFPRTLVWKLLPASLLPCIQHVAWMLAALTSLLLFLL